MTAITAARINKTFTFLRSMTEAMILVAAVLILNIAILAAIYFVMRDAQPPPSGPSHFI